MSPTEAPSSGSQVIPGPTGDAAKQSLRALLRTPLEECARLHHEFGDICTVRVGPFHAVLLFKPEHVQHLLVSQTALYDKDSAVWDYAKSFLGQGLVTADGAHWARQRQLSQPAFHPGAIAQFVPVMTEIARGLAEQWDVAARANTTVAAHQDFTLATFHVVGRTLLGTDFSGPAGADIRTALDLSASLAPRRQVATWASLNGKDAGQQEYTQRHQDFTTSSAQVDQVMLDLMQRRRKDQTEHKDLLQLLLRAEGAGVAGFSDQELVDQLKTLVVAGHDTTANTLAFLFYVLALHPNVAEKIRQELAEVLTDSEPDMRALSKLTYLDAVIKETLRLYPTVWRVERRAAVTHMIDGFEIPEGTSVSVYQAVIHRRPDCFPEPEEFRPERFLPGAPAFPKYAYFPFSWGPRVCIGAGMSVLEVKAFVAELLPHFNVALPAGFQLELKPRMTLSPKSGLPLLLTPRGKA